MNRHFRALKARCGIARNLRPHDLRRTTAVKIYEGTKDLRTVQTILGHKSLGSTIYYLDHDMVPIPVAILELAKLNPTTETIE
jgi:site-specific recombinase XerC